MYIRFLKGSIALTTLICAFLAVTRYIEEVMTYRFPANASLLLHERQGNFLCEPDANSILSSLHINGNSTLIIILDGYPTPRLYKRITGKESGLHKFLLGLSDEHAYGKTIIDNTAYSIPYILAGILPSSRSCRYPYILSRLDSRQIVANQYFSSAGSLCREYLPFSWDYLLDRWKTSGLFSPLEIAPPSILMTMPFSCSLASKGVNDKILLFIKDKPVTSLIWHEVLWHDFAYINRKYNLRSAMLGKGLQFVDANYYSELSALIGRLMDRKLVSSVVIMSDHGPRLELANSSSNHASVLSRSPKNSVDAWEDNRHGFFLYYISINSGHGESVVLNSVELLGRRSPLKLYTVDKLGVPIESQ